MGLQWERNSNDNKSSGGNTIGENAEEKRRRKEGEK